MIRLGRMTDYAVSLLTQMSSQTGHMHTDVWTAPDLAEKSGLPLPSVAKILKILAKAGIIEARRGASGGYRLARCPKTISIAAIIEAMDGPIALTECSDGGEQTCRVESLCPMNGGWNKLNTAIRQALAAVSLADMSGGVPPGFTPAPLPISLPAQVSR